MKAFIRCYKPFGINICFGKGATAYEWQIWKYYGGWCFLKGGNWKHWWQLNRFYFRKEMP